MANTLTPNAIPLISDDENKSSDPTFQPVLQLMNVKKLSSAPGSQDRYRIIISDGTHFLQGMLASQLTPLVQDGSLQANCLIKLKGYMRNRVQNTTICIALQLDVIHPPIALIGNPAQYGDKTGAAGGAAVAGPLYNSTNGNPGAAAVTPPKKYGSSPPKSNPYGQRSSPSGGTAPIVRSHTVPSMYTPIKELNMYQNRWTIRARVVSKSDVRTWSNAKGEGRLFSVELQDESCDIRATFFKEAVDKFYNMLQVSQVYTFAGGRLKVANLQYNTCKSNHEITFDQNSEVHLDTSSDAQRLSASAPLYEFVKINAIEQVAEKQSVDVMGLVTQVGEVATILSKKSGREMTKVDVTLVDDSAAQINVTFWGQTAAEVTQQVQPNDSILAVRRARVSDYNGKSLSGSQSHQAWRLSQVQTLDEPLRSQALGIAQWWRSQGGSTAAVKTLTSARSAGGSRASLAERRPLASIRQDHLGTSPDSADIISVKAEISFIKKDKEGGAWYTACPEAGEPCKNRYKVTPTTDGQYHCEKCGRYYPNCTRRWIFSALLEDESSSNWGSFFNEQAETLLGGATADEVYMATNNMDGSATDAYEGYFAKALHSEWVFRCKVKQEMVNDEPRTKTSVVGLFPVDYVQDAKDMLAALQM
jgi:replication factor A1